MKRIFIFPTFLCTLSCPRCYQRQLHPPRDYMMSARAFQRIIEGIERQKVRDDEWVFTGGEPTCWMDLTWAIEMVKRYRKARVRVVTNGYRRTLSHYGAADIIQVSDYGAINRMDYYRLKKEGKSRVKIQAATHWDWDMNQKTELPGDCGCAGLAFVGERVWPCAMAAAAATDDSMHIEDDFAGLASNFCAPHYQQFCRGCLVNRKNRKGPKPVLQISLWEHRSWICEL